MLADTTTSGIFKASIDRVPGRRQAVVNRWGKRSPESCNAHRHLGIVEVFCFLGKHLGTEAIEVEKNWRF